jgi:hypothetical protein
MKNPQLTIIAGPCSIDEHNIKEIYDIASLEVQNSQGRYQPAIAGTRIVGLKSRTELNASGTGMGIDHNAFQKNHAIFMEGGTHKDFIIPPSVVYMKDVYKNTNMLIATEVMDSHLQMPFMEGMIPEGKALLWNPAVMQLGWPLQTMAAYAQKHGWYVGIKNGKWLDHTIEEVDSGKMITTMEKTWAGLAKYTRQVQDRTILIHRGVDIPNKGNYRNYPVHETAKRTKQQSGAQLYFDPSHAFGPKKRNEIVPAVIEAMKMTATDDEYLYDGILIEVGTSQTDTDQHISVKELEHLVTELARTRDLVSPDN